MDTLTDTSMPFTTAFFDSDNTTIVLTKDYINCERDDFITSDDGCLVHADSRQWSVMLPMLKRLYEMTSPCHSLP